jgi:hypothetical protein
MVSRIGQPKEEATHTSGRKCAERRAAHLTTSVAMSDAEPVSSPRRSERKPELKTMVCARPTLNSPLASGKNGLFTCTKLNRQPT